jgi:hypothetical protein
MFWPLRDHHQAVIMIERLELFELPNMDPNLVQHVHIQSEYLLIV